MPNDDPASGPIIVWGYYGYEGWNPVSYPDLKTALLASHGTKYVITRKIDFTVTEKLT